MSRTKVALKCSYFVKYNKINDLSVRILNLFADLALLKDWLNFDGGPLKEKVFLCNVLEIASAKFWRARREFYHPYFMGKCPTISLMF